ncbi:MAG: DUF3106 domain-containing protein [Rhodanobacteraceae bacterium]
MLVPLNKYCLALALTLLLPAVPAMAGMQTGQTQSGGDQTASGSQGVSSGQTQVMSTSQSAHVRAQAQEFQQMSPGQQRRVLRAYRYYQTLPEQRRQALRSQWRHQAERERALQVDPAQQPKRTGPGSQ